MIFSACSPVTASMRRTPAEMALSVSILKNPMLPVALVCVPPQSSTDVPKRTMRTLSPYFSPKSIMAPHFSASSLVASRFSSNG